MHNYAVLAMMWPNLPTTGLPNCVSSSFSCRAVKMVVSAECNLFLQSNFYHSFPGAQAFHQHDIPGEIPISWDQILV